MHIIIDFDADAWHLGGENPNYGESESAMSLQEPLRAILQQLEAVVAGHIPKDCQRVPELRRRLLVCQRPAALIAIPPQVPA